MAYNYNPTTQETEAGEPKFKAKTKKKKKAAGLKVIFIC
jgi:hypothetical protein